ncbi:I78 family peptidase inhibitor [Lysobacter sp. P5_B9]|nr:I78 family peptidase inhibitor [Lysobacter sp.]
MPRRLLVLTAPMLLALGACTTTRSAADVDADTTAAAATATTTGNTAATPPMQPGCNAEAARSVVGQMATAETVEQARSAAGAEIARTLKPGQVVTMEYNASRLNIDVDAGNTISNVRCG